MLFFGDTCYANHKRVSFSGKKKASVCDLIGKCLKCDRIVNKEYGEHSCDEYYCKNCGGKQKFNHRCYMKPLEDRQKKSKETDEAEEQTKRKKKKTPVKVTVFIFYDFETTQSEKYREKENCYLHEVNFCAAQTVCTCCMNVSFDSGVVCQFCCGGNTKFFNDGDMTLENFVNYVLSVEILKNVERVVCMAHNSKGFDGQFILKHLLNRRDLTGRPAVILNGTKLMLLKIGCIKFIDSLNYFAMRLSSLPKAFGLKSTSVKGTFPHFFNRPENQHYRGPLPAIEYYGADTMGVADREKFETWYAEQKQTGYEFDFQTEIARYCKMDVCILREACLEFRRLFMSIAPRSPVCPFTEANTMASACSVLFRKNYLAPETIGIIPVNGYRKADNHSKIALEWLILEERKITPEKIIHAGRDREYYLPEVKVHVDGYRETDKEKHVYQFHGCYYHGCVCMNENGERTARQKRLYERTMSISTRIRAAGYILHEMWECVFKKSVSQLIKELVVSDHPMLYKDVLNPRDAFFGGRTGHMVQYYKIKPGEKIHYIDICSLYPAICKFGKYPIGHPKIYVGDECMELIGEGKIDNDGQEVFDISVVEGFVKCIALPPADLYHPVLPVRMHSRLFFSLCRTCTENMTDGECAHTNPDERSFLGTWTSVELQKAVECGYRILKIYEIWHYEVVSQYSAEERSGGIFAGYINSLFKFKTEASGFPAHCTDNESRRQYIAEIEKREGITLSYEKIEKNAGLRAVAKLGLNCLWGRFGMRQNLPKTSIINSRETLLELITDDTVEVLDVLPVNDNTLVVNWCHKDGQCEPVASTNVAIAAQTTALARLKLLSYLEKLDARALYFDTDSVFYVSTGKVGEYEPPIGDNLGDMTDELTDYGLGSYISEFVACADKFYAYKVIDAKNQSHTFCKVKGITLNSATTEKLNFESIKSLVINNETEKIKYSSIIRTKAHDVLTKIDQFKICRPNHTKRSYVDLDKSYPFGYKRSRN